MDALGVGLDSDAYRALSRDELHRRLRALLEEMP
jgi:hypothetical protein